MGLAEKIAASRKKASKEPAAVVTSRVGGTNIADLRGSSGKSRTRRAQQRSGVPTEQQISEPKTESIVFTDPDTGKVLSGKVTKSELAQIRVTTRRQARERSSQQQQVQKLQEQTTSQRVRTQVPQLTVDEEPARGVRQRLAGKSIAQTEEKLPEIQIQKPLKLELTKSVKRGIRETQAKKPITQTSSADLKGEKEFLKTPEEKLPEIQIQKPLKLELTESVKRGIRETQAKKPITQTSSADLKGEKEFLKTPEEKLPLSKIVKRPVEFAKAFGRGTKKSFIISFETGADIRQMLETESQIGKQRVKGRIGSRITSAAIDPDIHAVGIVGGLAVAPRAIQIGAGLFFSGRVAKELVERPSFEAAGEGLFLATLPFVSIGGRGIGKAISSRRLGRLKTAQKGADFSLGEVGELPVIERDTGAVLTSRQKQLTKPDTGFLEVEFRGLAEPKVTRVKGQQFDVLTETKPPELGSELGQQGRQLTLPETMLPKALERIRLEFGRKPPKKFDVIKSLITKEAKSPTQKQLPRPTFERTTESGKLISSQRIETQRRFKRITERSEMLDIMQQLPQKPLITPHEQAARIKGIKRRTEPKPATEIALQKFLKGQAKQKTFAQLIPISKQDFRFLEVVKEDVISRFDEGRRLSRAKPKIEDIVKTGTKLRIETDIRPFTISDLRLGSTQGRLLRQRPKTTPKTASDLIQKPKEALTPIEDTGLRIDVGQRQDIIPEQDLTTPPELDLPPFIPPEEPTPGRPPPEKPPPEKPPPEKPPPGKRPIIGRLEFNFPKRRITQDRIDLYNVKVKEKGRFIKVNKEPIPKIRAKNLGADVVDNTPSATFKINKVKQGTGFDDFRFNKRSKFRQKGKNTYQEFNKHRIDSIGELQGITVKGYLARTGRRLKI